MKRSEPFARHDWVWLPEGWRGLLGQSLTPNDEQAVADWVARKRPLVAARRLDEDPPGFVRLGLALPGKRRIGLLVLAQALTMSRAPLYFLDAAAVVAEAFTGAGAELARRIEKVAPQTRVFGSIAWQFFAGDPACRYVTPESDIDLLLRPDTAAQLWRWIDMLHDFEQDFPAPRLDGEIALPDGSFVAWREFAARPNRVLAKSSAGVSLRRLEELESLLVARAA
jgi:phosphoribosyl-dephospho-CoA transferase